MSDTIKIQTQLLGGSGFLTVGRLGAVVNSDRPVSTMTMAALDMAERHILRLEAALRKAGINVDELELPE